MDLQTKILSKIGTDKFLHLFAGGWMSCLATNWYYALVIAFIVGLGKELVDKYIRKSSFDYYDWIATFLGGCITAAVLFIIHLFTT